MKILHCADIHIDSPLQNVADGNSRRRELLQAFSNMVEYAAKNNVDVVIIAGDLFDGEASRHAVQSTADILSRYPNLKFYVLRGNHGGTKPYAYLQEFCSNNVHFFGDDWTYFDIDNVTICGRELGNNDATQWKSLQLDNTRYNILVLHGDIESDSYGIIDKEAISQSNANYVALGHRHAHSVHHFGKVLASYSGVLETRGFDETQPSGVVLLDTDANKLTFLQLALRKVITKEVDIGDCSSEVTLENVLLEETQSIDKRNYLNLIITGQTEPSIQVESAANRALNPLFYAVHITDKTRLKIDVEKLSEEISLRGQFVKLAMEIEDSSLRQKVIRMGLSVLEGELV